MWRNKIITLFIFCCLGFALTACIGGESNLAKTELYQNLAGKYCYVVNDKIIENDYIVLTESGSFYDSKNNLGRYSASNDIYSFKINIRDIEVELFSGTIGDDSIVYTCYNKTYKYVKE